MDSAVLLDHGLLTRVRRAEVQQVGANARLARHKNDMGEAIIGEYPDGFIEGPVVSNPFGVEATFVVAGDQEAQFFLQVIKCVAGLDDYEAGGGGQVFYIELLYAIGQELLQPRVY